PATSRPPACSARPAPPLPATAAACSPAAGTLPAPAPSPPRRPGPSPPPRTGSCPPPHLPPPAPARRPRPGPPATATIRPHGRQTPPSPTCAQPTSVRPAGQIHSTLLGWSYRPRGSDRDAQQQTVRGRFDAQRGELAYRDGAGPRYPGGAAIPRGPRARDSRVGPGHGDQGAALTGRQPGDGQLDLGTGGRGGGGGPSPGPRAGGGGRGAPPGR